MRVDVVRRHARQLSDARADASRQSFARADAGTDLGAELRANVSSHGGTELRANSHAAAFVDADDRPDDAADRRAVFCSDGRANVSSHGGTDACEPGLVEREELLLRRQLFVRPRGLHDAGSDFVADAGTDLGAELRANVFSHGGAELRANFHACEPGLVERKELLLRQRLFVQSCVVVVRRLRHGRYYD